MLKGGDCDILVATTCEALDTISENIIENKARKKNKINIGGVRLGEREKLRSVGEISTSRFFLALRQ